MSPIWMVVGLVLILVAFLVGYALGLRALAWWKLNMFRDIETLIGTIHEVSVNTNDPSRIDVVTVLDQLTSMKRDLHLPYAVERREERFM